MLMRVFLIRPSTASVLSPKTAPKKKAAAEKSAAKTAENPTVVLGRQCASFIEEKKGENISFLDLRDVNSYLEFFIICTANSKTHCRALAKDIEQFFAAQGLKPKSHPDYDSEWVIIDYFNLVVHVFTAEMREHYDLDRLWADAARL